MAEQTVWASSANNRLIVPDSLTSGKSRPTLNQDRWSENFQDLSDYCNTGSRMEVNSEALSGEQLNTPNIIVQDEFYFGLQRSPGERFDLFDNSDPWEASAQLNSSDDKATELWGTVNNWLATSNRKGINDDEAIDIIDVDVDGIDPNETPFDIATNKRQSPIKLDGDYLLSQSPTDYKQLSPPLPVKELNREQSYIDLMSLLQPNDSFNSNGEHQGLLQQPLLTTDLNKNDNSHNNNNNNNKINMNNVSSNNKNINNNDCFPLKSEEQTGRDQSNLFLNISPTLKESLKLFKAESFNEASINNNSFTNRRDPVTRSVNNLSSLFKSEEPIIGETDKSCFTSDDSSSNSTVSMMANNKEVIKVRSATIKPKVIPAAIVTTASVTGVSTTVVSQLKYINRCVDSTNQLQVGYDRFSVVEKKSDEYIIPEIKTEPIDINDMEVESINEHSIDGGDTVNVLGVRKVFKMPVNNSTNVGGVKKTGLKLDIDSASKLVTSTITPTFTPTTSSSIVGDGNVSLSTPDVLRPLLNSNGEFNLLSYIGEDGASEDLEKNGAGGASTASGHSSPVVSSKKNPTVMKTVRRRGKTKPKVERSDVLLVPLPTLTVIKEEKSISESAAPVDRFQDSDDDDDISPVVKQTSRTGSKRRRVAKRSDDMEFDLGNISDYAEEDDEKHDKTFQLTPYQRKRTLSTASRTSTSSSYTGKSRQRDTDSSDHESVTSVVDRYRELRDRNNEASRRSRLNRKSREGEMKQHAVELEAENRRLKAKADEMERLVKRLREGLMQLVLKKR